ERVVTCPITRPLSCAVADAAAASNPARSAHVRHGRGTCHDAFDIPATPLCLGDDIRSGPRAAPVESGTWQNTAIVRACGAASTAGMIWVPRAGAVAAPGWSVARTPGDESAGIAARVPARTAPCQALRQRRP